MRQLLSCALLLAGCGFGEPPSDRRAEPPPQAGEESATAESGGAEAGEEAPTPEIRGAEDERARVIREAEAFVRAQGYTDTPPTVSGDAIVHEGIEGTIEQRRGMLEPGAVRAMGQSGDWMVVFRYRDPAYAGRGRALRIRAGQAPVFVHQDLLLSPPGAGE